MRLTIADEVIEMFPEVQPRIVVAAGLRNDRPWAEVEQRLRDLEAQVAAGEWVPPGADDPAVASWHEAYRRFGTNPRRFHSKVIEVSRDVVFIVERISRTAVPDHQIHAAQAALLELVKPHAANVTAASLDAREPIASL